MKDLTHGELTKLIDKEIKVLEGEFKTISDDKRKLAKRLIERVAFMTITLEVLEDDIKTRGPTYLFEQGSQKMIVENPSQKSFNTMINRYNAMYSTLINLLPKDTGNKEESDGFEEFVMKR